MKIVVAFFSFILLTNVACKTENKSTDIPKTPVSVLGISYIDSTFTGEQFIEEGDTLQTKVAFTIPQIEIEDKLVKGKINKTLMEEVKSSLQDFSEEDATPVVGISLKSLANKFIDEAAASKDEESPAYSYTWDFGTSADTLYISDEVVSFYFSSYSYTGGAHPNSSMHYLSFDLKTGNIIDIATHISDSTAFKKVVRDTFFAFEKAFAKEEGIEFDESYYFFDDNGELPLPSMAIVKDGLQCVYSPYEVAAYARGMIVFTIPNDKLKGIYK